MLSIGDFVKPKKGTKIESGEIVDNWAGEIIECYPVYKTCLIKLDAPSLNSMSDSYIIDCLEEGAEPYEYIFEDAELEKIERRDTNAELKLAVEHIAERMEKLEEDIDYDDDDDDESVYNLDDEWIEGFYNSSYFEQLNDYQQENAPFVIETFDDYMGNYVCVRPEDWDARDIGEVCLGLIPRKISAEAELFENYADILIVFFDYLGEIGITPKDRRLQEYLSSIRTEIAEIAQDSSNWGMAKSFMMLAQDEGVDVTDQNELDNFMQNYNRNLLLQRSREINAPKPVRANPYKDIGRNQKITVKYTDGKVMEDIKFKKVHRDLENGLCTLIKK